MKSHLNETPSWVPLTYDNPQDKYPNLSRFFPLWILYAIRQQRGISLADIAKYLGISRERVRQMFLVAADGRNVRDETLLILDAAITAITDQRSSRSRTDGSISVDNPPRDVIQQSLSLPYCPEKGCTCKVLQNRGRMYTKCKKHMSVKHLQENI